MIGYYRPPRQVLSGSNLTEPDFESDRSWRNLKWNLIEPELESDQTWNLPLRS